MPELTLYGGKDQKMSWGGFDTRTNNIRDGVFFCTYALLISARPGKSVPASALKVSKGKGKKKQFDPELYDKALKAMIKKDTRLHQIIEWLRVCI